MTRTGNNNISSGIFFDEASVFTNLDGLKNISIGNIHLNRPLEDFDQNIESWGYANPICPGIYKDKVSFINDGIELDGKGLCTTNDGWMDFFHEEGMFLDYAYQKDIPVNSTYSMSTKGLNNSSIPTDNLTIPKMGSLYLNNNELTNVDFLNNLETTTSHLYLQDNDLTNLNGLSNLTKVTNTLHLANNNLTNLDGLESLDYVSYLYTVGNVLSNINGLSGLTDLQTNAYFDENSTFTDISPLSNLTDGDIYLNRNIDNFDQQTTKLAFSTPFCQAVIANEVNFYGAGNATQNPIEMCTTNDEWMDLFHDAGQLEPYATQAEVPNNATYSVYNQGLNDSNIPSSELTFTENTSVYFYNNEITNVDFLSNLTKTSSHLYLQNNDLTNLNGLSNLTKVTNTLHLANNNLTNLDGLENLDYVGYLYTEGNILTNINGLSGLTDIQTNAYFDANATFTDISPLSNLIDGKIYLNRNIDNFDQQTTKLAFSTPFCQGIIANTINFYGAGNATLNPIEMCTTNDEWMDLFHDGGQLETYSTQAEVPINTTYSMSTKGLNNSNIPSIELTFTTGGNIYYDHNDFTNLSGLSNLTRVSSHFRINDNNLTNLDGLENLDYVNYLWAEGNLLTNINGLSGLTDIQTNAYFDANATFTDISPLSNLTDGDIYLNRNIDDFDQQTTKLAFSTPFCQGIIANTIKFYGVGNATLNPIEMCTTGDDWMDFFHDNAQLESYSTQAEVPANTPYVLASKNLTNNDLPSSPLTFTSSDYIYIQSNQLTNVDFLSNLTKSTSHMYLQNNDLTNLNGLSNLTSVTSYLRLDNNNLTNLDGLEKLDKANRIYTEGNSLTNIDGLSGLTDVNYLYFDANSTFTDLSSLSNLTKGHVYLKRSKESFTQYTSKWEATTPICQAILSNAVNLYNPSNTDIGSYMCE